MSEENNEFDQLDEGRTTSLRSQMRGSKAMADFKAALAAKDKKEPEPKKVAAKEEIDYEDYEFLTQEEFEALSEEEQLDFEYVELDELDKSTLKSYVNKVAKRGELDKREKGVYRAQKSIAKQTSSKTLDAKVRKLGSVRGLSKDPVKSGEYDTSRSELKKRGVLHFAGKRHGSDLRHHVQEDEQEDYVSEESIAAATLKAGSRPDDNPKSKIDFMTKTLGAMNSMNKGDLTKWYDQAMALIGKEASGLPAGASADSNSSSIDMKGGKGPKTRDPMPKINVKEDVEEMFTGEELSEEFKDKASTLFEAAVHARAIVEIARLEEEYETRLEEEVTSILEGIESNLDTYLDYVVENWMKENEVAIESSLRNEIMEEFIGGLKNLFAEHYIEMPEEKIDVVEELAAKVERLEATLDETINENAELKEIVLESHRQEVVGEIAEGLTMSQSEKFLSLAEGVDFDGDLDVYKRKLSVVKESYFPSSKPQTSYIEEETFEGDVSDKIVSYDPQVNRYVQAISRTVKK